MTNDEKDRIVCEQILSSYRTMAMQGPCSAQLLPALLYNSIKTKSFLSHKPSFISPPFCFKHNRAFLI